MTAEHRRLAESDDPTAPWRRWGPYVSARQWGTVREDYSADGDAWAHFPFDHAHRRAYRWGEDGIAGLCDVDGHLNLAVAMWNGRDDRLKERFFGLTNPQGNHGEDVKEYWWHLEGLPTHSYASSLYRYPQAAFPYEELLRVNGERGVEDPEHELADTGVLDQDRFFDVVVTHAKAAPGDIVVEVTATNHGPEAAPLHLLPQVWFRNTWSWGLDERRPVLWRDDVAARDTGTVVVRGEHHELGAVPCGRTVRRGRSSATTTPTWRLSTARTRCHRGTRHTRRTPWTGPWCTVRTPATPTSGAPRWRSGGPSTRWPRGRASPCGCG
ncbi:hypothetical protein [Ornithinimicrobium flavum]|uniref:hypothetical protein n=1 Tax=Ornithinimicrobium flavum TaxID=1288636 RepID=UPI003B82EE78